jgi:hypothetical protein
MNIEQIAKGQSTDVKNGVDVFEMIESLLDNSHAIAAPSAEFYDNLQYGQAVAQGEYLIQYVGTRRPASIPDANEYMLSDKMDSMPIGNSSHKLKLTAGMRVFSVDHPLVACVVYLPADKTLALIHHEHSWPAIRTGGYYFIRMSRDGAVSDSALESPLVRPRVD